MIAIIHVTLMQGEFLSLNHLHDFAVSIYPHEDPPAQGQSAGGVQRYISVLLKRSVHTCIPTPGAYAAFLWLNSREFEIVIETFYSGHLLRSAESVVGAMLPRLKQFGINSKIHIFLHDTNDAQIYINGELGLLRWRIWKALKDNVVAIVIAVIIVILSRVWLKQFLDEAIAIVVSLTLFSLWEVYSVWSETRQHFIYWRIHE